MGYGILVPFLCVLGMPNELCLSICIAINNRILQTSILL